MRWSAAHVAGSVSWLAVGMLLLPGCRPRPAHAAPSGQRIAVVVADGVPVFWKSRPFLAAYVLALLAAGWRLHRRRVRALTRELSLRADERLAERTRIAQELYDTLLQGFLSASMQLHVAVDSLAEGSPERERLDRVLRVMGQVTEEGRIVLQGLRSSGGDGDGLEKDATSPVH